MEHRTFTSTVEALRFGTLGDELTDALRDVVARCASTGRAGAITLTLSLKPGKGGQIEVFDEIKTKLPKEERGSSLMFATPENNLQREDPRQLSLPHVRSVEVRASVDAPVREVVDEGTGEIRRVG